ncbi:MAG: sulfite exporter TauE/SafE family protein [bacterium]|nr:sulfite exporter TauE/SafE family protein [bacterium]
MIEVAGFVLLGLITGVIASTLGVGGGIIFVPALVVFFSFEQHLAQGTSLAVIVPTVIVGTWLHAKRERVDSKVAVLVGTGGVVGGLVGSQLALGLDPDLLRRLFAALLVLMALRMLTS